MAAPKGHPRYGGKPKGYKSPERRAREVGRARALRREEITAERTMLEIARLAFVDRRGVFTDTGTLKPVSEWTGDQGALLEGFEVIVKNAEAGDGHTDRVHKVHLARKFQALETLAKHFGLITDKVKLEGKITLEHLIALSRGDDPDPSTSGS